MNTQEKNIITASEVSTMLNVSNGFAYKIIRELNAELKERGYIVIAGKVSRAFFEERWYDEKSSTKEREYESSKR